MQQQRYKGRPNVTATVASLSSNELLLRVFCHQRSELRCGKVRCFRALLHSKIL